MRALLAALRRPRAWLAALVRRRPPTLSRQPLYEISAECVQPVSERVAEMKRALKRK